MELARDRGGAIAVFANTVETLKKVYEKLAKSPYAERLLLFTGEIRGKERDELTEREIFKVFERKLPREQPAFLLATAAAEVGVNFDADHMVCDLVSLERMAQRLGRVNRFGKNVDGAEVRVILPMGEAALENHLEKLTQKKNTPAALPTEKAEKAKAEKQRDDLEEVLTGLQNKLPHSSAWTYRLLKELSPAADGPEDAHSASPEALSAILQHEDAPHAYSPASGPPPLDLARLDDWSLTSLSNEVFPRPRVSYWLRGITPDDTVTVTFAWRDDLRYAADAKDAVEMAGMMPLDPQETAQLPIGRALKWLLARAKKQATHAKKNQDAPPPGAFAVIRPAGGEWKGHEFKDLLESKTLERDLVASVVLLPTSFGGLNEGGFPDEGADNPVPDAVPTERYERALLRRTASGQWEALKLNAKLDADDIAGPGSPNEVYKKLTKPKEGLFGGYRLLPRKSELEAPTGDDDDAPATATARVEYFAAKNVEVETPGNADLASLRGKDVPLEEHLTRVENLAQSFVNQLGLPAPLAEAVVLAAKLHDTGKNRAKWQRAIGNFDLANPLAKSKRRRFDRTSSDGYRHEFGSLMEALENDSVKEHPERDLILHLIAAHHGHARPEFNPIAYDFDSGTAEQCAEVAQEAELRFERLQRRFGHWELAYLEALVKCADGLASAIEAGEFETLPDATPEPAVPVSSAQQMSLSFNP